MKRSVTQKITVGMVCSPWLGGSGVVGSELAKYLVKTNNYKVVFIGFEFPFRMNEDEVVFHKVEGVTHALFHNPLDEVALVEGIVEAVIQHKIKVLHAHFAIPFAFCALQAREILKKMGITVRVVTTLHGTDVLFLGREVPATMKYVLEQSDAVTSVSKDLSKRATQIYHTKKEIRVVYNFINFNQYSDVKLDPAIQKEYSDLGKKIFVHISNFRPIKRIDDCLKVFLKVNRKIPSVLLLIGEGPELNIIRKKCNTLKIKDSIHFIGRVKDPYQYLKIADGLIITSEYESFCLVGLEAMACGVPVFSTNVGGIPEVIKHKKSGYLVPLGDTETLSNYAVEHFSDQKKVSAFQTQGRKISYEFSAEKIIPQYEAIYREVLAKNNLKKDLLFQSKVTQSKR